VTNEETIALFPQEWNRDPASSLIRSAYHDVPWDSPTLVRACISEPSALRRVLTPSYWRQRKQQKLRVDGSIATEIVSRLP
jgi:hypothetical protein